MFCSRDANTCTPYVRVYIYIHVHVCTMLWLPKKRKKVIAGARGRAKKGVCLFIIRSADLFSRFYMK